MILIAMESQECFEQYQLFYSHSKFKNFNNEDMKDITYKMQQMQELLDNNKINEFTTKMISHRTDSYNKYDVFAEFLYNNGQYNNVKSDNYKKGYKIIEHICNNMDTNGFFLEFIINIGNSLYENCLYYQKEYIDILDKNIIRFMRNVNNIDEFINSMLFYCRDENYWFEMSMGTDYLMYMLYRCHILIKNPEMPFLYDNIANLYENMTKIFHKMKDTIPISCVLANCKNNVNKSSIQYKILYCFYNILNNYPGIDTTNKYMDADDFFDYDSFQSYKYSDKSFYQYSYNKRHRKIKKLIDNFLCSKNVCDALFIKNENKFTNFGKYFLFYHEKNNSLHYKNIIDIFSGIHNENKKRNENKIQNENQTQNS